MPITLISKKKQPSRQAGCQIDYLIQTRYNTLFVCEIKFIKNPVPPIVIQEVKDKISKLSLPRGYACLPVLIHVNGIAESIDEAAYFFRTIDFGQLL